MMIQRESCSMLRVLLSLAPHYSSGSCVTGSVNRFKFPSPAVAMRAWYLGDFNTSPPARLGPSTGISPLQGLHCNDTDLGSPDRSFTESASSSSNGRTATYPHTLIRPSTRASVTPEVHDR